MGSNISLSKRLENLHGQDPSFTWGNLIRSYWFLLGTIKRKWLLLTLVLFAIHFYILVPPLLLGRIVDFLTKHGADTSLSPFYWYTGILGISFVVVSFVRLSLKRALGILNVEVMYNTKVRGFDKLLDFSLAWHLEENAGAKTQRIKSGVESYQILTQKLMNEIMHSLATILGIVGVFLFLQPVYVIFFIIYAIGFWIIVISFYKRIQIENDAYFSSVEDAGGSSVEGLSNILTIKTLGADEDFKKHVASKELTTKEYDVSVRGLYNKLWKTFQAFNGVCYGIFLVMVGRDVLVGQISPGAFVVFYGYLQNLIGNANEMIDTYETVLTAKSGIARMMSIFWAKTSITAGTKKLSPNWDALKLRTANFAYRKQNRLSKNMAVPSALKNVSLAILRYAKVGVVGKTGSGKSTFAKILAGLYPLTSGEYMVGETSFYELAHDEQTSQLTLVLQETEIFNFSLRDNITLMRDVPPKLFEEALTISQLNDVLAKLPNGLETPLGERGYHLSGGERQRVGIARAICKNSPIMIFDEATSSLDSRTESRIQQALETKLKDKTIIIIAHRVSTLQKTDTIYVFENGRIVETGTFKELSGNKKSKFHELSSVQQRRG